MDMRRNWGLPILLAIVSLTANAQVNEFEKAYNDFRKQTIKDYADFRDKANKEYADFMRQAWERYHALPEIPKPKDEPPIPPTPYPIEDEVEPIKDTPRPYEEVIVITEPEPQPKPIAPIREQPQPVDKYFDFTFFHTEGAQESGYRNLATTINLYANHAVSCSFKL